jgi:hypothetical protein
LRVLPFWGWTHLQDVAEATMDAPEPAAVLAAFGISGPVVEMTEMLGGA